MSELIITGTVIEILEPENGISKAGKEWNKRDFVIETQSGTYTSKLCFTLFGDKTDLLAKVEVGAKVEVSFNIESREYNGKYFHNINAWKIVVIEDAESGLPPTELGRDIPPPPDEEPDSGLPF